MRLICPNCEAQYEVADDAIPPGGRDVQCSNCQTSWYQTEKPTVPGRKTIRVTRPTQAAPAQQPSENDAEEPQDTAPSDPQIAGSTPRTDNNTSDDGVDAAKTPRQEATPQPQRKPLDDAVVNILREEASRGAATAGAASVIAKPPPTDTARPTAPVTADATRQRIAQMTAEEGGVRTGSQKQKTAASNASADEAHLRTVPSINEINATLRARAQANDTSGLTETEKVEAVQRKGFRRGFFLVLIIFAILILPYVFAREITETLPQTTDIMASYVLMVDQIRVSLNELISGLTG